MTQQTRPIDSRHEPQARPMVSPQYLGAVHDTLREMGYSPRNGMRWCATRTHSRNEFGVCGAMFGQMVRLLDVVCEFVIRRVSSFSTLFGYLVRGRSLSQWRRDRSSSVRPRPPRVTETTLHCRAWMSYDAYYTQERDAYGRPGPGYGVPGHSAYSILWV